MDELQIRCAKNENKTTTVTYDEINNIDIISKLEFINNLSQNTWFSYLFFKKIIMIIISKSLNFIFQVCRSVLKEMFFFVEVKDETNIVERVKYGVGFKAFVIISFNNIMNALNTKIWRWIKH